MASSSTPAILVPAPNDRLDFTGERFVPGTPGEIEHEHLHRYFFAMELCRGRDVIDVASGEGYGSALLATVARSVVGIELIDEVVKHARRNYARPNLAFHVGDCAKLPVESGSVDVAVSFETLEHIDQQAEFLAEIKRVLRPQGLLVMSSPVRGIYSPGNPNPFHVKELTREELRDLIGSYFRHVVCLRQSPTVGSAIIAEDAKGNPPIRERTYWRQEDGSFEVAEGLGSSPYLVVVASDVRIPELHGGLLQDRPYIARLLGALLTATGEASARADVERNALAVQQHLAASRAELEEARQVISSLERANQQAAAETALARRELDVRIDALAQLVQSFARVELEVKQLRGTLEAQARKTLRAAVSKVFSWMRARGRRAIAVLLPRRVKGYIRRLRLKRRSRLIADTGLFDSAYYLAQNPDVAAVGMEPIHHYLTFGVSESRDPHEMFDTSYYLEQNPDVVANGVHPLLHFYLHGLAEDRRPHPSFSANQYRTAAARSQNSATRPESVTDSASRRNRPGPQRFETRPLAGNTQHTNPAQLSATRTLAVSHVLPFPPRAGNEYRIHRMVKWLQSIGHEVHLVVSPLPGEILDPEGVARAAHEYPNLVVCANDGSVLYQSQRHEVRDMLSALTGERPRSFSTAASALQAGRSERIANLEQTFCPDHLMDLLLRLERSSQPDMVISNYIFMSRFLPMLGKNVFKVIDTIDVFSTKNSKVLRFGVADPLDISGPDEAALLKRADLIVAIQPNEAVELRALAPDQTIVTAGVDFQFVGEVRPPPIEPVVLYVASSNALNVKGVRDFLSLAWPLIRREVADARMLIVGPVCEALDDGIEGVELLGRVDRLEDLYARAKVVVNLAVAGTGLKIKTLEALSQLRPIVVWPSGVDGLSPEAQRFCDVAQDWYDFARRVVRQLNGHQAQELVAHREEIANEFSPEVVYGPLREKIEAGIQSASSREVREA